MKVWTIVFIGYLALVAFGCEVGFELGAELLGALEQRHDALK